MLTAQTGLAQRPDEAHRLGMQGIALVDEGDYAEGIKLLSKAQHAHPAAFDYPFELGRAHLLMGKAAKAEKYLFPLQYHQAATPELYLVLSACYDSLSKPRKQEEMLRYGLQKFPNVGRLYLGLASYYAKRDSVAEALAICELGLKRDPSYPENYALASRIMDAKGDALWAWWYGEVFLNLSDDAVMKRGLAKLVTHNADKVFSGKWSPGPDPLDRSVADAVAKCAIDKSVGIINRQGTLRWCLAREHAGTDPFTTMLRELERQNILELYAAYLFAEVDRDAFLKWLSVNAVEFERFKNWFYWNGLKIDTPFTRQTISSP
jgi:tetratricopeptide (TPR) repeat protein